MTGLILTFEQTCKIFQFDGMVQPLKTYSLVLGLNVPLYVSIVASVKCCGRRCRTLCTGNFYKMWKTFVQWEFSN